MYFIPVESMEKKEVMPSIDSGVKSHIAGFPVLKARPALSSQDVELRPNARRLLPAVGLVHVEAHSLREAAAAGGARVALL